MVRPLTVTWRHVCVHDSNVQVLRMTSTWLWCHHPKTAVRVMVCTQAVTQRELSRFPTSERKIRSIFEHFRNVGSFVILISGACCCKLLLTLLLGHLFTKLFEITVMLLTV